MFENDHPDSLLIYRGYVVNFNTQWKIPNWTIYELTPEDIDPTKGKAKRRTRFYQDKYSISCESQAKHADYTKSGFDRGHLTPAGDQSWNQELKDETFLITNIAPQFPDLNRGIWEKLESGIRKLVRDSAATCYIVTGTILDAKEALKNKIGIPSYFYKIIYSNIRGKDYLYCFLVPHLSSFKNPDINFYQTTLKEIEKQTHYHFFEKLSQKKLLENKKMNATESLGIKKNN